MARVDDPYNTPIEYLVRSAGSLCGWCMAGQHDQCKPSIRYYSRIYICSCKLGCADESFIQLHKQHPTREEYETNNSKNSGKTTQEAAGPSSEIAEASIPG